MAQSTSSIHDEYVEGIVCNETDIKENEMKAFKLNDVGKILLIRQNGRLSAIGSKCPHYGAPLENGVLSEGRIRCAWHGACFNIATGDIEEYPGLDSLPCYQVSVDNGQIKVRAKRNDLETNKRCKLMIEYDQNNSDRFVVIGGGPSGQTCIETLRQNGYNGKITLICKENYYPYDRVRISKWMDMDIKNMQFRIEDFYTDNNIEVLRSTEATKIDTKQQSIELSNGTKLNYTQLYIATGMRATKLPIPGADLKDVLVIRNYDDGHYTHQQLNENIEVVMLGSSFTAMEVASYCSNKVKKITVVARGNVPFEQTLGERVGRACMELLASKGVHFIMNSGLKQCIDTNNDGKVDKVELLDGTQINADLVIMAVGGRYNTEFLQNSGINLRPDGSVDVDDYLQTNIKNIYAGGDIAYAPVYPFDGHKSTIGHFSLAHYHGRIAALNMINHQSTPIRNVPYFWTSLYGKSIRYAGHGKFTNIIYHGNVEQLKFVAYYLNDDNRVIAVSSCAMDPITSQFAELQQQNKQLMKHDLDEDLVGWTKKLYEKYNVKL